MKRFGKLLIAGLLVGGLLVPLAGCADDDSFVPPDTEGGKVTINDAYDWNDDKTGSTRPELGGDYEAVLPPTEVVVTLAEDTSVRFKGGETTFTLPVGKLISQSDFDAATLGGKTVSGFAVIGEEKKVLQFAALKDFVPLEAVTVMPYFAPEKGDAVLFGSNEIGDYYFDAEGNELDDDPDYELVTENAIIDGLMGKTISCAATLAKDSFFRSVTVLARESGQSYAYHYNFKNLDDKAVSFTVYQMHSSYNWQDKTTCVASEKITLEAGASQTVSIAVKKNNKNDKNTLTLIKFEEDAEGFNIGVSMAAENTVPTKPATITLNLPEKFTVTGYETNVRTNDKLVLPTAAQIKNETGHRVLGWAYSYANGTPVVEGVRILGDIAIEPILTEDIKIEFFGLPENFSVKSDYKFIQQSGDRLVLPTAAQVDNGTGHKILHWVNEDGDRVQEGIVLTEDIKITPVFTEDAVVTLDLPDNFVVTDYENVFQQGDTLVLPNENQIDNKTGNKLIRWVDSEGNVVTNATVLKGNLTIRPELSQNATISVKLPTGLTLADDYKTAVQTGDVLVVPTVAQIKGDIADGRELLGWYIMGNGNKVINENTVIHETEVTIAPYFSRRAGTEVMRDHGNSNDGKPPVFCNNQGSLKPMNVYDASGNNITNGYEAFDAISDKWNNIMPIGGGDGYAEYGNFLKYNGTLTAGMMFRAAAMISHNNNGVAVVKLGVEHTFYYNFENLGESNIHFTVQGVNNGKNVEGPVTEINLKPGESTTVTFKVTYTSGSDNRNVIAFFKILEDVTDMKLGVSVNIVLGRQKATVAIKSGVEGVTLNSAYTDVVRYIGDSLVLPTADDYTNTTGKEIIGWQDASGNALSDGQKITGDIQLQPVFKAEEEVTPPDVET